MRLGNLFIIAAPSGAGKSSLLKALFELSDKDQLCNPAKLSVSHTTRSPRVGEQNGVHYHFVDHQKFESMIADNAFYEYAEVFENYYGTSKQAIQDDLESGIDVFLDIDWQGARQIKLNNSDVISIFVLPPSESALRERLLGRGQDSNEVIEKRMQQAQSEMSHYNEFDYVIVNDDFTQALTDLKSIVVANSLKFQKQSLRHQNLLAKLIN